MTDRLMAHIVNAMTPAQTDKDVHTEHCCAHHGCKYSKPECTVITGQKRQSHMCEWCDEEFESMWNLAHAMNEMYDKGFTEGRSVGWSER